MFQKGLKQRSDLQRDKRTQIGETFMHAESVVKDFNTLWILSGVLDNRMPRKEFPYFLYAVL